MQNAGRRCYAVKGANMAGKPLVSQASLLKKARRPRAPLHRRDGDGERHFSNRLAVTEHGPGYCHFPVEFERDGRIYYGEDYFKQLRAEHAVKGARSAGRCARGRRSRPSWRNEALDLRVYNMAALAILNPDFERLAAPGSQGSRCRCRPPKGGARKSIIKRSPGRGFVPGFSRRPARQEVLK